MNDRKAAIPTTDTEWNSLIDAWIAASGTGKGTSDSDPGWWAISTVIMFPINKKHHALWEFIIRTFEREMSDSAFGALAAGPLEDLLGFFGELYIDRIEELARQNPRFNYLLGGVWKHLSTDDVWRRIEKARLGVWK